MPRHHYDGLPHEEKKHPPQQGGRKNKNRQNNDTGSNDPYGFTLELKPFKRGKYTVATLQYIECIPNNYRWYNCEEITDYDE
ncbi:MAG: hypothetical protein Tsb0034_07080 [Ekhidna sp.]